MHPSDCMCWGCRPARLPHGFIPCGSGYIPVGTIVSGDPFCRVNKVIIIIIIIIIIIKHSCSTSSSSHFCLNNLNFPTIIPDCYFRGVFSAVSSWSLPQCFGPGSRLPPLCNLSRLWELLCELHSQLFCTSGGVL